ncbi:peroxisomal biogenesis factor 6 isoform X2 [Daktulosphaira vitifoliae]|uniref:peroxisomal biogenesis factor 6 isoform X2 n=1 Tax=Daktulosphaira vitifoliae TaxID=58002 RepID=UPI0021AAE6C4|nr:peroxisomal biogenesis factor 6 isoform X2 [Daktulosphaira vitifoliae]
MDCLKKSFLKYIVITLYILKLCQNTNQVKKIIRRLLYDLKLRVLFGLEVPFKCVPEKILEKLLNNSYNLKIIMKYPLHIHKCIFISQHMLDELKLTNFQWVFMNVCFNKSYKLPILHYNRVIVLKDLKERNCILTSTNLFNLKNCDPSCNVFKLRLIKPLVENEPKISQEASIIVSKPFNFNNSMQKLIDKAFFNYFTFPIFVSVGDVLHIDLNKWYPENKYLINPSMTHSFYIKILNLKGKCTNETLYNFKKSAYITNKQTKLIEVQCLNNMYLPSQFYYLTNNSNNMKINNYNDYLINIIPDGLQDYGEVIKSWIQPFISNTLVDLQSLKPLFLVFGNNGDGKNILIKSLAQFIGLKYISQCCFEWPTNNIAQLKKKIEYFFEKIRKHSPCLLHLENVEALCLSSTKDLEQELNNILEKQMQIKTTKPIIIIGTTNLKEKLSPSFLRLFLQVLEIKNLNKISREKLLKWMLKNESIDIETCLFNKIIELTSGYNYSNYLNMILIATKHNTSINSDRTYQINLSEFDIMFAINEINTKFSKSIGSPSVQTVNWDDIGGLQYVKEEILMALKPTTYNIKRSGLLLYGPPGTGKTLLAKAVATECNYNFLSIKGPELLNMYIGQSEANVREVFNKARSAVPCILFFDELDSVAPKRGQNGDSGGVGDRVVSQLLTEMDGVNSENQEIFVLGATNRPDLIDSALIRPGRLDKSIYVGGCEDKVSKTNVLKALTRKFKLSSDFLLEDIVEYLPNMITGADLYGICYNAWLISAKRVIQDKNLVKGISKEGYENNIIVNKEDFIESLKNQNII